MKEKKITILFWSLLWLLATHCSGADSVVVFNEVMYHPELPTENEWIELHNQLAIDVDISGWSIRGGVEFVFPEGTFLPGGAYLVVADDPTTFGDTHEGTPVFGPFIGRLSNAGETIELVNNSDRVMDRLDYDDSGDWPAAADGSGVSLAKKNPDSASEPVENWGWSDRVGGTPGVVNFLAADPNNLGADTGRRRPPNPISVELPRLAFNEISGAGTSSFWLEIVNYGETAIDPAAFCVSFSGDRIDDFVFLDRSMKPGELLVLSETELGFVPEADDKLFLYTPDKQAVLDAVVVDTRYRARKLPGQGEWFYPHNPTPGLDNQFQLNDHIVFNEIMYHPRDIPASPGDYQTFILVALGAEARTLVSNRPIEDAWTGGDANFDDSHWTAGIGNITGVGYETGTGYEGDIGTDIRAEMVGETRTMNVRIAFEANDLSALDSLTLNMKYDDGFVAFLNGREVARANAPIELGPEAGATASHEANSFEQFDITPFLDSLRVGQNILAIQGLNYSASSSDLLILPELIASREISPPTVARTSPEEWIELYNRSTESVDLTGWRIERGVRFAFPPGTVIEAGAYLLIARDRQSLADRYPDIVVVGDYDGKLSNKGERLLLVDAWGNPVDDIRYYDDAPWPGYADGYGASLELRDPHVDNTHAGVWCASDEGRRLSWKTYVYRGIARPSSVGPDGQWHEFVMGLLDAGEVLLDDIHVVEDPDGSARPLIQNSDFESGSAASWRILGNHRHSKVVADPGDPTNHVLHLRATGPTEHMHNHIETTLAQNRDITNGREYEISFRAKWIGGSNQLNTRLYFNRLAKTTLIEVPTHHGTPGKQNSCYSPMGPTLHDLRHEPAVPNAHQPVTVSVKAHDPDGILHVALNWRVDGQSWNSMTMDSSEDTLYSATIPGQEASTVVQFYAEAWDTQITRSILPVQGLASRALYQVNDNRSISNGLRNLRLVMTSEDYHWMTTDIQLMSNDRLGATVIADESKVFYDVGVRLKSSQRHRHAASDVGFKLKFPADNLFLGIHKTVAIDRSEGSGSGQREMLTHQAMNHAGGALSKYNDMIHLIAPRSAHSGTAELQLARFGSVYLDGQFDRGSDGTVYELEYIYYPYTTRDGDPESYKRPQPDRVLSTQIRSLGENKEDYRWVYLIKNNRRRDDFSAVMELGRHFGSRTALFQQNLDLFIDVGQWLSSFVVAVVSGTADHYSAGGPHNAQFYVRPEDGRFLYFPHDLDLAYKWNRGLVTNNDLSRMLGVPAYERLYYGYMHHMLTTSYNAEYMSYWTTLFKRLDPQQSFDQHLAFIGQRSSFLRNELRQRVVAPHPFNITRAVRTGGATTVALEGRAWIDVKEIFLQGRETPLLCIWTSEGSGASKVFFWQANVDLAETDGTLTCTAIGFNGSPVGTDTIQITRSR